MLVFPVADILDNSLEVVEHVELGAWSLFFKRDFAANRRDRVVQIVL